MSVADRKRRENVIGGRRRSHLVRVSPDEHLRLAAMANRQDMSVPRLLVESALAADSGETITERRETLTELFQIRKYLSAVSNNVNQIARATNATGELAERSGELSATLDAVRGMVYRVDSALRRVGERE